MLLRMAAVAALLLTAAAPVARADETLSAGPLRVDVRADPFAVAVTDTSDGDVLRTLGGDGAYGPLQHTFDVRVPVTNNSVFGYGVTAELPTGWFRATRLESARREGDALQLLVASDDPLGDRYRVRIGRRGDGIAEIRVRLEGPAAGRQSAMGAAFAADGDERYLGFGERSNAVDQTGQRVISWAEEGPFSSGDYDALTRNIPDFTFPTGPTTTNLPMPWLVSTRGFGVLLDNTERNRFELRRRERRDGWRVEAETNELVLAVYAGPRPADVLRRYSGEVGRQPVPPPWVFGAWYQPTGEAEPLQLARRFRAGDVPVSAAQTYTHYLPCGAHVDRRDAERARVRDYHRLGYRITTYVNPHVCTSYHAVYDPADEQRLFVRNAAGRSYLLTNPFTADEIVSEVDFTNPAGVALYGRLLDDPVTDGYDGWMEDFGEYTPVDARFFDGTTGKTMHNRLPVLYHAASTRHTPGEVAFIRSGYHGVQPFARVVWGGDPTEDWSCSDGLCAAVHQALSTGLSGLAYWGSDVGGFHAVVNGRTSDELNIRWLWVGFVSGVLRTQANGYSLRDDRAARSQVWSPAVYPVFRRIAKLRTQLYPYLAAASAEYQRSGMPISRALALAFPADARAARAQEELMFGPDLLAAPVIHPGERSRSLHVPAGRWVDLWRSVSWDDAAGTLHVRPPAPVDGGERTLPAPLEELPLLARAGTLLPLLAPDVDTLAGLDAPGVVDLADRRHRLRVLGWPSGHSSARFHARGLLSSSLSSRRWRLVIRPDHTRTYELEVALPFRPRRVTVGGHRKRFSFGDGVLRMTVRQRGRVTVRARG